MYCILYSKRTMRSESIPTTAGDSKASFIPILNPFMSNLCCWNRSPIMGSTSRIQ